MATAESQANKFRILVVDDEPDIHSVTRLSLRGLSFGGRGVELLSAASGADAVKTMRENPDIAVILLDVVMESKSAGLDACRAIRGDVGNTNVRIILRTGQPGQAPERETIDGYDIDGYLAKADLDATRLYSAVRTALKAWDELVRLERHQHYLNILHQRALALHSYDPLPTTLAHIVEAALEICPARLGVLELNTFEEHGNPQRHTVHLSTEENAIDLKIEIEELRVRIAREMSGAALTEPQTFADGVLVPLSVHRELGQGWLYLAADNVDDLAATALTLLAGHAANALYSAVAEKMLSGQEDVADSIAI